MNIWKNSEQFFLLIKDIDTYYNTKLQEVINVLQDEKTRASSESIKEKLLDIALHILTRPVNRYDLDRIYRALTT